MSRDITRLEAVARMRRDFIANVSHELKTPLTVLAGFIETLSDVDLDERQRQRCLALMQDQAKSMQRLVADLLALSALFEGKGHDAQSAGAHGLVILKALGRRPLKNLQPIVDFAPLGNDHPDWCRALAAFDPRHSQFRRNAQPDVIAFERAVADQNRVRQRALTKQMHFIFTRSARSEPQLLLAPKSYKFYPTADEARRHFELEPLCEVGELYEVGWGGLQLSHGMTDWRRIEVAEIRRGAR